MKLLLIIFLAVSLNSFAQTRDSLNRRSARRIASIEAPPLPEPMLIVNEKLYNSALESIDARTIINMQVTSDSSSVSATRGRKSRKTIFIITKPFAVKSYQEKLGAVSREYQSYLKEHNGKDDDIQYILNNDPLENKGNETANVLYKLPPEKIIGVTFTERPMPNGIGSQKVVIIDAKAHE